MPLSAMPPAMQAGAASQAQPQRDPFSEYVNRNNFIPVWLHPDLAAGVIQHFGRDGRAFVHPHPASGYLSGGVVPNPAAQGPQGAVSPPEAMAGQGPPMMGIRRDMRQDFRDMRQDWRDLRQDRRSIFGGGRMGEAGPADRRPEFVQAGGVMDGRAGTGKVPGKEVPATQKEGHDSVHAMLDPGEAVINKKQLRGIQVKPGKGHLLRADQKRAIKEAGRKNAR